MKKLLIILALPLLFVACGSYNQSQKDRLCLELESTRQISVGEGSNYNAFTVFEEGGLQAKNCLIITDGEIEWAF